MEAIVFPFQLVKFSFLCKETESERSSKKPALGKTHCFQCVLPNAGLRFGLQIGARRICSEHENVTYVTR
jgi:hypothetical protein